MSLRLIAKVGQVLVSALLIAAAVWVVLNHQYALDTISVWQYRPSQQISALTERMRFTERGEFYFYSAQPQLSDQQSFNRVCINQEDHNVVLGCYVGQRIYIYDVADEQLDGVREVTAAHEMLHAAYERLSDKERTWLADLLEAQMTTASPELTERLKVYDKLDHTERMNELHSVVGTEVAPLSTELEDYYGRYFSERASIVKLFDKYQAVFVDLRQHQESLIGELNSLAEEVNVRTVAYNTSIEHLNNDIERFNQRAMRTGGFDSQEDFNTARNDLLRRQTALQVEYDAIEAKRIVYEEKYSQLEALNVQQDNLQRKLDSTPAPVPAV